MLSVSGDEAYAERSLFVDVLNKSDYLDLATELAQRLKNAVISFDEESDGNLTGLVKKAERIQNRLQGVSKDVDNGRGNERSLNNKIESVIEQLEGFEESLEGRMETGKVSSSDPGLLQVQINTIIDKLHTAVDADS